MKKDEYDFSGYATAFNIKCTDGRIIRKDAFKHHDGAKVPLVWQHMHDSPENVLGHAVLEHREDGMYAYGWFNETESGLHAKSMVQHGDIEALSIHANRLKQKGDDVYHGNIKEVSLVLSGANLGAVIDYVQVQHSDGKVDVDETEAVIYSGLKLSHEDDDKSDDGKGETVKEVFDTLNEKQKNVVYAMLADAIGEDTEHSDDADDDDDSDDGNQNGSDKEDTINHEGGNNMKKNVFDKKKDEREKKTTLTHADIETIFENAKKCGSLKEAVLEHSAEYGIENIDYLFPDAKKVTDTPEWIKRDKSWVAGVINGVRHTPFSRIKSLAADITADEARAKGYVTGNEKIEEVFPLLKRVTYPTTVYKKQKLDRDDIIDITDMDVVAWLKMEMRWMLDEEIGRSVLIGDGREVENPDKINEENVRPIYKDESLYAHQVKIDHNRDVADIIEDIIRARRHYKGSGNPTFFTTTEFLTEMLLVKDDMGRRLYSSQAELESTLRVNKIVDVEVMEDVERNDSDGDDVDLLGIMVNLKDYVLGTNAKGKITFFDDFDIDYNQYKYLLETRYSGALVKPKSALVIEQKQS